MNVSFVARRLGVAIPTLILVALAVFMLIRLIPGDPATLILGDTADAASLRELRARLGLDQSLPSQLLTWVGHVARGDFGTSIVTHEPVLPLIVDRFEVSFRIVFVTVAATALISVPIGMLAAWRQNSLGDTVAVGFCTLLLSIPTFWLGLLILLFFGVKLGWLPVVGYVSFADDAKGALLYMIMPVATLVLHEIGVLVRMARASTLDVMRLDYVMHARAKGLSETAVLLRHVFPNAFAPTLTLLGLMLGNLLGGIAIVETVFTIPGLGRLLVDSIFARDYPVIQGCLMLIAFSYVIVNLIVDLLYPLFDPRVINE